MPFKIFKALIPVSLFLLLSAITPLLADRPAVDDAWITNGKVNAVVQYGSTTYIGGNFSYVGPYTGSAVFLSTGTGVVDTAFPKFNADVYVAVSDGDGGWYVGGNFTKSGGIARKRAARIRSDGSVDSAWNPEINGTVLSLLVNGATVYAGGNFTSAGGASRNRIAALNAVTGAATDWNPGADAQVRALALIGTKVYAGGDFTNIGGASRNQIAALDTLLISSNATSWDPSAQATVRVLVASGSFILAGGDFTSIGGAARNRLAALDTTVTSNIASTWNPNVSSAGSGVFALVKTGTAAYVGGSFTTIGGKTRNRLAKINLDDGSVDDWDPGADGSVSALAPAISRLFVGGAFNSIGGASRNRVAEFDLTGVSMKPSSWNPDINNNVIALSAGSSRILAGGEFTSAGGATRNNIAALSSISGKANYWNPSVSSTVYALAAGTGSIFAGGEFTAVGGGSRNYIAEISLSSGAATSWNPDSGGPVKVLLLTGSRLYVGGTFTVIGGQPRNRIAALDVSLSSDIVTAWNPNSDGAIQALAYSSPKLYVGGSFTAIGGAARVSLAELDTEVATNNASQWNPSLNAGAQVNALLIYGTTLYAGGSFSSAGGDSRSNLAALDTRVTSNNRTSWNPGANSTVRTLTMSSSVVYAGGDFTVLGAESRPFLAGIDTQGNANGWRPNLNNSVYALALSGTKAYAGGGFTNVDDELRPYFAQIAVSTPAALEAFSSFQASATSTTVITWAWSDLSNEDRYRLNNSTGGYWSGSLDADTTQFTLVGLSTNTAYAAVIQATNSQTSSVSSAITVYTLAGAPLSLTVSTASHRSFEINWSTNSNPPGTRYVVELASSPAFVNISTPVALAAAHASSTAAITGLLPGVSYNVRVWSYNGDNIRSASSAGPIARVTSAAPEEFRTTVTTTAVFNSTAAIVASTDSLTTVSLPAGITYPRGYFNGVIAISNSPGIVPIAASSSAFVAANKALTSRQFISTASAREFVFFSPAGVPVLNENFSSAVTITVPYPDANQDGLLDGSSPPITESQLLVYTLNETTQRWESAGYGAVNTSSNTVSISVQHFSIYAVGGTLALANLDSIKVYPTPWKPGRGGKFDAPVLTFDGLTNQVRLRVVSIHGELIYDGSYDSTGGSLTWNGLNQEGQAVASGAYLWLATNDAGDKKSGRLVIER